MQAIDQIVHEHKDDLIVLHAPQSYLKARQLPKKKTRIEAIAPASSIGSTQSRASVTATKNTICQNIEPGDESRTCFWFVTANKFIPVVTLSDASLA